MRWTDILSRVVRANPGENRSHHKELFLSETLTESRLRADDPAAECVISMAEYCFAHKYQEIKRLVNPQLREEQEARRTRAAEERIETRLLNTVMPNGKQYRECTKVEVARFGRWHVVVAERMRDGQMVGEAFTEQQLVRLYEEMRGRRSGHDNHVQA